MVWGSALWLVGNGVKGGSRGSVGGDAPVFSVSQVIDCILRDAL